jgi:hypothetical protein
MLLRCESLEPPMSLLGQNPNTSRMPACQLSLRARARLNGNLELSRRIISFVTHDEQKSLRCMRSYGRVSHPLRPCDRVGHAATFPVFGGWF